MRVLITGGEGSLGRELIQAAQAAGLEACALGRSELEVTSPKSAAAAIARLRPQLIINCAAYTAVDGAESAPERCAAVNTQGAALIAALCAKYGAAMLQISTDYVFGSTPGPHPEDEEPQPLNVYGRTKLEAEIKCRELLSRLIIVRTGCLFGSYGRNLVKTVLLLTRSGVPLSFIADNLLQPTPAAALAALLLKMGQQALAQEQERPCWGVYHCSGTPAVSSAQFARRIVSAACQAGVLPRKVPVKGIQGAQYQGAAARPQDLRLDCTRLKTVFGLNPPAWEPALVRLMPSFKPLTAAARLAVIRDII